VSLNSSPPPLLLLLLLLLRLWLPPPPPPPPPPLLLVAAVDESAYSYVPIVCSCLLCSYQEHYPRSHRRDGQPRFGKGAYFGVMLPTD
jgi:hypothetical protein